MEIVYERNLLRTNDLNALAAGVNRDFSQHAAVASSGKRRHLAAVAIDFSGVLTLAGGQGPVAQVINLWELSSWFTVSFRTARGQVAQNLNGLDLLLLNFLLGVVSRGIQQPGGITATVGGASIYSRLLIPLAPGMFAAARGRCPERGACPLSLLGSAANVEVTFAPALDANNTIASPVVAVELILFDSDDEYVYQPIEIRAVTSAENPIRLTGPYRRILSGFVRPNMLDANGQIRAAAYSLPLALANAMAYDADDKTIYKTERLVQIHASLISGSPSLSETWPSMIECQAFFEATPALLNNRVFPVQIFAVDDAQGDWTRGPVGAAHVIDGAAAAAVPLAAENPTYVTYSYLGRSGADLVAQLTESGLARADSVKYAASNTSSREVVGYGPESTCGLRPDQLVGAPIRWPSVPGANEN